MTAWLLWLVLGAALGVAEILTLTLYLGLIAVGAVAAAVVASVGAPALVQAVVFAVVSGGLVVAIRPVARRHGTATPQIRTGAAALVGRTAIVVQPVAAGQGQVKIGGEVWSARPYDGRQAIPVGAVVDVLEIEGATALVYAEEN